jgi:hypothetical protein
MWICRGNHTFKRRGLPTKFGWGLASREPCEDWPYLWASEAFSVLSENVFQAASFPAPRPYIPIA